MLHKFPLHPKLPESQKDGLEPSSSRPRSRTLAAIVTAYFSVQQHTAATDSAVGTSKKVATELTEEQLDKVNG